MSQGFADGSPVDMCKSHSSRTDFQAREYLVKKGTIKTLAAQFSALSSLKYRVEESDCRMPAFIIGQVVAFR